MDACIWCARGRAAPLNGVGSVKLNGRETAWRHIGFNFKPFLRIAQLKAEEEDQMRLQGNDVITVK